MTIDRERKLLLSVKPRYARKILSGQKTIELRRTRPRVKVPTEALIYASSPVRALVGHCRVEAVIALPPEEMWTLHGEASAVSFSEFEAYFVGAPIAYGLVVTDARPLTEVVGLKALRASWEGFQPPQSFRYLPYARGDQLVALGER